MAFAPSVLKNKMTRNLLPSNNQPNPLSAVSDGANVPAIMQRLVKGDGLTYREIAKMISDDDTTVSPALVWKVANGRCKSHKIDVALGIRPKTHPHRNPTPKGEGEPYKFACDLPGEWRAAVAALGCSNAELVLWAIEHYEEGR